MNSMLRADIPNHVCGFLVDKCSAQAEKKMTAPKSHDGSRWAAKHSRLWSQWGLVDSGGAKYSRLHTLKGIIPNDRITDCIDLCYALHEKQGPVPKTLVQDVSQDIERKCWSATSLPTLTTSSELFYFSRNRTLTGEEFLACLGFSPGELALPITANAVKDLAADAFAVPCVAVVATACVAAIQGVELFV